MKSPGNNFYPSPAPTAPVKKGEEGDLAREITVAGWPKQRSPIPVFPRPLGVSYQHFNINFPEYDIHSAERMEAGYVLVSSMLQFYFPRPKFTYWRLWVEGKLTDNNGKPLVDGDGKEIVQRCPYDKPLVETVHTYGTIYMIATVNDKDNEDILTEVGPKETVNNYKSPTSGQMRKAVPKTPTGSSVVLLIAIVTDRHFRDRSQRKCPSRLLIDRAAPRHNGSIEIDGQIFERGHIVILGGQSHPVHATFEFYTFDAGTNGNRSIFPWYGQLASRPDGLGTNIFPTAPDAAENVDRMFRAIVSCSYGDSAVSPSAFVLPPPVVSKRARDSSPAGQTPKRGRSSVSATPAARMVLRTKPNGALPLQYTPESSTPATPQSTSIVNDVAVQGADPDHTFLLQFARDRAGKLFHKAGGRKANGEEVRRATRLAVEKNYKFPPPSNSKRRNRRP